MSGAPDILQPMKFTTNQRATEPRITTTNPYSSPIPMKQITTPPANEIRAASRPMPYPIILTRSRSAS